MMYFVSHVQSYNNHMIQQKFLRHAAKIDIISWHSMTQHITLHENSTHIGQALLRFRMSGSLTLID